MFRDEARRKIEDELARGSAARQAGLEGRARVCARRAAGAAIREYLELRGLPAPGPSAYDLLASLHDLPDIPDEARQAAESLLERVDESFALPAGMDLLELARKLARMLEARV